MIYRRKNKNKNIIQNIVIGLVILVFLFGFFNVGFFGGIFSFITSPIAKAVNVVKQPFNHVSYFFSDKNRLIEKINSLEEELDTEGVDDLKIKVLEEENKILRGLSADRGEESYQFAKILVKPPYSPYDTLTIDQGSLEGLSEGDKVFYRDVLLGYLAEVNKSTSIVSLVSMPQTETSVSIDGRIDAVAQGKGGGRVNIIIPKDTEVEEGDIVAVPSSEVEIIGVISKIETDEADSFKTLFLSLPVSLSQISFVEIRK